MQLIFTSIEKEENLQNLKNIILEFSKIVVKLYYEKEDLIDILKRYNLKYLMMNKYLNKKNEIFVSDNNKQRLCINCKDKFYFKDINKVIK